MPEQIELDEIDAAYQRGRRHALEEIVSSTQSKLRAMGDAPSVSNKPIELSREVEEACAEAARLTFGDYDGTDSVGGPTWVEGFRVLARAIIAQVREEVSDGR